MVPNYEMFVHFFSALYKYINSVGPSIGCLTVFAGVEGNSADLGLPKGNMWAFLK